MISKRDLSSSKDLDLGNPSPLWIEPGSWVLVRDNKCVPPMVTSGSSAVTKRNKRDYSPNFEK